jgi:hypothetical protein
VLQRATALTYDPSSDQMHPAGAQSQMCSGSTRDCTPPTSTTVSLKHKPGTMHPVIMCCSSLTTLLSGVAWVRHAACEASCNWHGPSPQAACMQLTRMLSFATPSSNQWLRHSAPTHPQHAWEPGWQQLWCHAAHTGSPTAHIQPSSVQPFPLPPCVT